MRHSILVENERRRLSLPLPWLVCFAMFTAWQIGVVSFSGDALSVNGRTPLGIDSGDLTPVFAVGYALSVLYMLIFPKRIAVKHLLVAYALVFILTAFLENNFFDTPFWVYKIFNVVALIDLLRDNTAFLYIVYLAIAAAMAALYLLLEPYLLYSFRGGQLIDDEEISELERFNTRQEQPGLTDPAGPPEPAKLTETQRNLVSCSFDQLTARELAVAEMLMQGFRYGDISKRLGIKKNTVYWYRRQLFDKLQIRTVHELFILAEKNESAGKKKGTD